MRVIGGRSRGRRLSAPVPVDVRPTSDRVREAIFDILGSLGGVEDLVVADLFCGTGAMGIEALSRGARSVAFVDRAPAALAAVRANVAAVGLADERWTAAAGVLPGWLGSATRFDLVFCDPPYAFDRWPELLASLRTPLAVLESSRPLELPPEWTVTKVRRYGGTLVTVARPISSADGSPRAGGS
jgi:16S rRNA (guanine966-N2)-methyltransferase